MQKNKKKENSNKKETAAVNKTSQSKVVAKSTPLVKEFKVEKMSLVEEVMPAKGSKLVITTPKLSADTFKSFGNYIKNFIAANKKLLSIAAYILIAVAAFMLVDLFVQYLNNGYSIALVNGVRVSRDEYYKKLEQISGQQISAQLIDETVFRQAAAEKKMTVTNEEIDTVVTQYQDYLGGKDALDKALKDRNSTLDEIRYSIETELLAKKLVTENTNVSDDDLKAFYEKYGSQMFPTEVKKDNAGKDILPDYESKKDQIKEVYLNQEYVNGKDAWLVERKKNVNIVNNYTTKPTYGLFKSTINLINSLQSSTSK